MITDCFVLRTSKILYHKNCGKQSPSLCFSTVFNCASYIYSHFVYITYHADSYVFIHASYSFTLCFNSHIMQLLFKLDDFVTQLRRCFEIQIRSCRMHLLRQLFDQFCQFFFTHGFRIFDQLVTGIIRSL